MRWYEVPDEDCEWILMAGRKIRCWHGIAVWYDGRRAYVPMCEATDAVLERIAADPRLLPHCLVGV